MDRDTVKKFGYFLLIILSIVLAAAVLSKVKSCKDNLSESADALQEEIAILQEKQLALEEQMTGLIEHLERLKLIEGLVSHYAPLHPDAIEGMCYAGDPRITASGAPVEIGTTVAADPSIPFGTRVWIEDYGWRVVQDRGGRIKGNRFDIAIEDHRAAFELGIVEKKVLVYQEDR